jgi:hypothetical protein
VILNTPNTPAATPERTTSMTTLGIETSYLGANYEAHATRRRYRELILAGDVTNAELPTLLRQLGLLPDSTPQVLAAVDRVKELERQIKPRAKTLRPNDNAGDFRRPEEIAAEVRANEKMIEEHTILLARHKLVFEGWPALAL